MGRNEVRGQVITARGPVHPKELGCVLMHEHLHSESFDYAKDELVEAEKPMSPERREFLMREGVSYLRECRQHGCYAYLETSPAPWRAWPTFYVEASEAANMHIILSVGFYRDMELGKYWVKRPEDSIWSFVRKSPIEALADFCVNEILEGMHGTDVHPGAIKLASSGAVLTPIEDKAFRAGARAQKATGVHITTHCTAIGAETTQLRLLEDEGVDLNRVVIGHTGWHLMKPESRRVCMDWMKRGANFLPTNLNVTDKGKWRPLIEAFHEIFDAGLGEHLVLGTDGAFTSANGKFQFADMPPPPFLYMFTQALPAFRELGLTKQEENAIMRENPQRILPVQ